MRRIVTYLAVTFGLTWGLLIPSGMILGTFSHGEASSPVMIALIAVSMFFPLVGALVANAISSSDDRIELAWRPRIRQSVGNYLVAWFVPALISILGIALFFMLESQWFDPTMGYYLRTMAESAGVSVAELTSQMPSLPVLLAGLLVMCLTVAPLVNSIPAFGEEAGWRGFLYPALCECISCRSASVASGIIWGLWHAPVIAMGHNYGMGYAGFPVVGILVMTLACVAFSCLLSWLYDESGSVWPCAVAHGAFNAIANAGVVFCTAGQTPLGPSPLGLVAGVPLFLVGFACWLRLPDVRRQDMHIHVPTEMVSAAEIRASEPRADGTEATVDDD